MADVIDSKIPKQVPFNERKQTDNYRVRGLYGIAAGKKEGEISDQNRDLPFATAHRYMCSYWKYYYFQRKNLSSTNNDRVKSGKYCTRLLQSRAGAYVAGPVRR